MLRTLFVLSIVIFSFEVHAISRGDIVYFCYDKKDGKPGAARAKILENSTEEIKLILLEATKNWNNINGDSKGGSVVYEHESLVSSKKKHCGIEVATPDSVTPQTNAKFICRVQRGGVFKNYRVLDEQPCQKIERGCFDSNGRHGCFINYVWSSGSKTVVEYSDKYYLSPVRINGQKAIVPNAIADHNCVLNLKTQNMLCVEETNQ